MSNISRAERNLCTQVLSEIVEFLPRHYVEPVLKMAADAGVDNITPQLIRNVKNERQFDEQVLDYLERVAEEEKKRIQERKAAYERKYGTRI